MFVAKELRKKSIAEYLLYMWQIEDIIRAMGCSLPLIRKAYISKFTDYTDEQKEDEIDWFGNLVVRDLVDLHQRLLQSNRFPIYNAEYYKVLPFIVELRGKGDKNISEIETCLDALYGIMMLRMQKKEISPETEHAIKEISTFIGMLSDYYLKNETEGLDFGEE